MPKEILQKRYNVFSSEKFLRKRELGFKRKLGYQDELCRKLISSLERNEDYLDANLGGIFNLEFSLNGSLLAAACEKKCIKLFDALNQKEISTISEAHGNCVNCIRFVDDFAFATGSDDSTIKMWDLRFTKECTRTLRGHSNWVKNIEYCRKTERLVSSAFDGAVFTWDLNNYTENGVINTRVYSMDGLMRMKLTPDCSKMVICSTSGYILIIHDLDFENLPSDLQRFKPNLYRLMQVSDQSIPAAEAFNNLFSLETKRNRVELVSDFPNEAEVVSSLQIHPMGWCALTRNINSDELSEWTCVHDIQERSEENITMKPKNPRPSRLPDPEEILPIHYTNPTTHMIPMDLWMGFVSNRTIREQRIRNDITPRGTGIRTTRTAVTVLNSGVLTAGEDRSTQTNMDDEDTDICNRYKIVQNLPRLTHYIEEPILGKGFIKELCFSPDGRIMCSPYNTGIRLLAFTDACNELSTCVPDRPQMLKTLKHFKSQHGQIVVSCKFNPYHSSLVSGCLGGQILWYLPVL